MFDSENISKIFQFNTDKNNIFFTSDTHFNHNNIIKYCKRPFDDVESMNESLINNWNSVVHENDIVFHLGDFLFGNINKFFDFRSRLNGNIYLIHGNHDYELIDKVNVNDGFVLVTSQMKIVINGQKIYLNHFPFLTFDGVYKDNPSWQLFGHVHSGLFSNGADIGRLKYLFPTQYDVGVDNNNYTPVSFSKVKDIINKQIQDSSQK